MQSNKIDFFLLIYKDWFEYKVELSKYILWSVCLFKHCSNLRHHVCSSYLNPAPTYKKKTQMSWVIDSHSLSLCVFVCLFQAWPPCWVWVWPPPTPPSPRSSPPLAWLASWATTQCGASLRPCTRPSCLSPTPSQVSKEGRVLVDHLKCSCFLYFPIP